MEQVDYKSLSFKEKIIYNILGILSCLGVIIFPLLGLFWAIGILGILLNWW